MNALDELEEWMDDFTKHPGASEMPRWLAAVRELRDGKPEPPAPSQSPADRMRVGLRSLEEARDELSREAEDLKLIMAGYAFAVIFYGDHLLGRCQFQRLGLRSPAAASTKALWICPPDCPVEARGG